MLKQIKKLNKQTNQNLVDQVIGKLEISGTVDSLDLNQLPITLFTFIKDLEISMRSSVYLTEMKISRRLSSLLSY